MTSLASKLKVIEKLSIDNSPAILTAVGVAGVITTAVLAVKAARKADRKVTARNTELHADGEDPLDRTEVIKLVGLDYIPTIVSGAATIGCIVMSNRIGTKRAAALAAAYTISEKAFSEYKEKVVEIVGENKEQKVRDEIAQDQVTNNPPREHNIIMVGTGDVLCMEQFSGRYFRSSVEAIKSARNDINHQINTHGYASMSDFYDLLGLPHTQMSDEIGWTTDKLMDVDISGTITEDGQPCVAINFMTGPVRDFHRFR